MTGPQTENQNIILVGIGSKGHQALCAFHENLPPDSQNIHYLSAILPTGKTDTPRFESLVLSTEFRKNEEQNGLDRLNLGSQELKKQPLADNREWARLVLDHNRDAHKRNLEGKLHKIHDLGQTACWFLFGDLGDAFVSGAIIDLTQSIRDAIQITGMKQQANITGIFTLPSDNGQPVELANAYAALRDLYHTQVVNPTENSTVAISGVEPLMEQIFLLPHLPYAQNYSRNKALARWLALETKFRPGRAIDLSSGKSRSSPGKGRIGILGVFQHQTDCDENLPILLEKACRLTSQVVDFSNSLGSLDWTCFCPQTLFKDKNAAYEKIFEELVAKIAPQLKNEATGETKTLPPGKLLLISESAPANLFCICERNDIDIRYLLQLETFWEKYTRLKAREEFPQRRVELPDIPSLMVKMSEPPIILAEYSCQHWEIVITSTPPEKIKAKYLVVPFSGNLSCPGEFSTDILNSGGVIVNQSLSSRLAAVGNSLDQEGDVITISAGDLPADSLLITPIEPDSTVPASEKVGKLLELIFQKIPGGDTSPVAMPLLALETPSPGEAREIARNMLEEITRHVKGRKQKIVVYISVCQPEVVAAFSALITEFKHGGEPYSSPSGRKVEQFYPFPIANPYRELMYVTQWDNEVSVHWNDLFKEILIFLTSITFSEALAQNNINWTEIIRGISADLKDKMELGNWVGLIRVISQNLTSGTFFIPEMQEIYSDILKNKTQSLVQWILDARNEWVKSYGKHRYGEELMSLIEKLEFLSWYRLIYIRQGAASQRNHLIYPCIDLTGCDPYFKFVNLECDEACRLITNQVYLVHEQRNEMLDMHPFIGIDIKKSGKVNWAYFYTMQGFSQNDLRRGKIIYQTRSLEHCPIEGCTRFKNFQSKRGEDERKFLNQLLMSKQPSTQTPRRHKATYLRITPSQ